MVSKRQFRGSGLTAAGLRGARYLGADTLGERVAAVTSALSGRGPGLVYAYDSDLDYTGHAHGWDSAAWRHQLVHVDRFAEQIYDELPVGSALVVTGDHGMVDVPHSERVDVDATPALQDGVELVGGEARFRHVYVRPGAVSDVRAAWREVLGRRAVVSTRDDAVAAGWFGAVESRVLERIGDLGVVRVGGSAIEVSSVFPFESRLVGLHGGLSGDEVLVPLLAVSG